MALTVIGVFDNASEAQQAVEQLVSAGFQRSSIDLSVQSGSYSNSGSDSYTNSGDIVPDRHKNTSGTTAEEVVDDTKDVGSSIGNFFSSLFGGDDDRTDRYSRVADRGSVVTVHAQSEDEAERASDILDDNGAVDVDERDATYSGTTSTTGAGMGTGLMNDTTPVSTDANQTIKVIEENLEVGKRTVETGGMRLRSRIIEKPVEESLRLREERVTLQRNAVNRPATDADLNAFQEGQIELTERAEVPVVSKTANVVEEVSLNKEVNEREEVIRDTVRSTDVQVEQLGTDQTIRTDRTTGTDSDDVTYSTK